MASMTTVTSVTLPDHLYPNIETRINDNSIRTYTKNTDGNFKMLAVSLTPKGKDRQIVTIDKGIDQYDEKFGVGPCSVYGQAHLNARAAASTGKVTLQVLRLTAADAKYANVHVYAHYRVVEDDTASVGSGGEKPKKLQVMFTAKTSYDLEDLKYLVSNAPGDVDEDFAKAYGSGWESIRVMSVSYIGRGMYGNNISFKITNHTRADKTSAYKNYFISVFEGSIEKERARVTLYPDALVGANSIYIGSIINDENTGDGSDIIRIQVNDEFLPTMFNKYVGEVNPKSTLTQLTFDPLLGINKTLTSSVSSITEITKDFAIDRYEILSNEIAQTIKNSGDNIPDIPAIAFNSEMGIALRGGDDGAFSTTEPDSAGNRQKAIDAQYIAAFNGEIDRRILSKYRCPLDFALDANFSTDVKTALANLTKKRAQDFRTYFDLTTTIDSLEAPYDDSATYTRIINDYTMSIDAYYGKIKDPFNKKVITVTSTYNLAINLPLHWNKYGGKHIPYAGPKYAIIDTYLKNSIYPVYDDSIDQKILDKLVDENINYAAIDPKGNVVRATQTTRYIDPNGNSDEMLSESDGYTVSNLSEENNVLIALDIKKDVEKLVSKYMYNFNETTEINTFNRDLNTLTNRYAAAQVHSITAKFERTTAEAELGVLHLYIALENKPLIKYIQVDIDVNRLSDD